MQRTYCRCDHLEKENAAKNKRIEELESAVYEYSESKAIHGSGDINTLVAWDKLRELAGLYDKAKGGGGVTR